MTFECTACQFNDANAEFWVGRAPTRTHTLMHLF